MVVQSGLLGPLPITTKRLVSNPNSCSRYLATACARARDRAVLVAADPVESVLPSIRMRALANERAVGAKSVWIFSFAASSRTAEPDGNVTDKASDVNAVRRR